MRNWHDRHPDILKCSFCLLTSVGLGQQDLAQTSAVVMVYAKLMGSVNAKVAGLELTAQQVKA